MPESILAMPLAAAVIATLTDGFLAVLTVLVQVAALGFSLDIAWRVVAAGPLVGGWFYVDAVSALFLVTVAVVSCGAAVYSAGYVRSAHEGKPVTGWALRRYYVQFNLFTFAMLSIPLLNNLGLVWIALELTTLASVFLVGYEYTGRASEAAWKYLVLSFVGAMLGLWSLVLLYYAAVHAAGPGVGLDWPGLYGLAAGLAPRTVKVVLLLALIGYGTKAGLAPMHTWLPDAHGEAPSPVSALLSGAKTTVSFYVVLRFYFIAVRAIGAAAQHMMLFFGLLSVAVAAVFILQQRDYKRLLAYSTVEHIGIAGLGAAFGTPLAIFGMLFHLFNHAVTKSNLFYAAGNVLQKYRTREIAGVRGILRSAPFTGVVFLGATLAIVGLPPSGVFLSELSILIAGFRTYPAAAAVLLLLLALAFAGMVRPVAGMVFGPREGGVTETAVSGWSNLALGFNMLLVVLPGLLLLPWLSSLLRAAAAVFAGR
ncbi:MAG: proton-conducting transporter membrane subunit [Peptococcaceae bacterium]|jgi:hydrogenase-4 component F|nr:proton-conducting transporter membrane subunit [Peptococcaceae bacterium]